MEPNQSGPSSSELPAAQNSFSNSGSNNPSSTSGQPLDAEHQLPRLTGHRHQQLALGYITMINPYAAGSSQQWCSQAVNTHHIGLH
ncbi:uncharacterized protein [Hetaerina americana]|uniref:uncharacterized protein isoform X3 n=1 Tax=Hetaerina americana TaxID=62018 RepID=UPI003A7F2278